MPLKLYASVAKELKLKIKKFLVEIREKTGRGPFCPFIQNKVNMLIVFLMQVNVTLFRLESL